MKVEASKLKKSSSDISPECRLLIDQLTKCRSRAENLEFLKNIHVWVYGKCELYHWIEILDRFDKILEEAARHVDDNEFVLYCDTSYSVEDIQLLLCVLNFTTLLIEHSFSRHLYNSIEHLTRLISSQNMDIVLAVLNLLYMFSKRSNFITRLPFNRKEILLIKLLNIAERWGDPNYGLALIDCCIKQPRCEFLYQLFTEYIDDGGKTSILEIPNLKEAYKSLSSSEVIKLIYEKMPNPSVTVKMQILHRARLIAGINDRNTRLKFVQARLQAVSVLIYSNALQENPDRILYSGFGEEICELIDKEDEFLIDIRAAALRTLTSMLHFDRNHNIPKPGSRLPKIIHYTGAERQGGILPLLVQDCISSLTGIGTISKYPTSLATSVFSLLYHLASYEAGGQALVRSGMMQSLIRVINWAGVDLEQITFVTRAVRVIDLITNIDIAKFHQSNGLNAFIDRLEKEINNCRYEIELFEKTSQLQREAVSDVVSSDFASNQRYTAEMDDLISSFDGNSHHIENEASSRRKSDSNLKSDLSTCAHRHDSLSLLSSKDKIHKHIEAQYTKKPTCVTQRAALLKSMLNFLKKCIQDHAHHNSMRNIMESSLPSSLRHIISMGEYYGPSLFLLATDVITVQIFNEPSILSSLQDAGITNAMLESLLQRGVPATREVLGSLPNIFSALCLNDRGLIEFMSFEPFDKFLKLLISPDYLVAMRRRRSSDPLGDTATNIGNAMDDLIKHHPYLRTDASEAIVRLLTELVRLGTDPLYTCWRANKDTNYSVSRSNCHADVGTQDQNIRRSNITLKDKDNENDCTEEEGDEDEDIPSTSHQKQHRTGVNRKTQHGRNFSQEREAIPLIDYIINVMKFIEAILNNSLNGEHCRQLVSHGGLKPLLQVLSLPNLPVDSPVSLTAQAVANVCKLITYLTQETKVIDTALEQLSQIVGELQPLINHDSLPGGSVLLYELLTCPKLEDGFSNAEYTPLLHNMSSVHGYVVMLVHVCRNASTDMRSLLVQRWGSNSLSGIQLLQNLVQLYISLVWESTVLLSFCSDEPWDEILHLHSKEELKLQDKKSQGGNKKNQGISFKTKKTPEEQLRFIKSLLAASSRLGRALAELFGTLVKLSVGTPQSRQRRNNDFLSTFTNSKFPSSDAKRIARVLSSILVKGFRHENVIPKPVAKLRLTFLICSVGFTGPMLFDDKRNCFHLMVSQFCEENGLQAFFDMFYWALSIGSVQNEKMDSNKNCGSDLANDEAEFPEGTGEFLDAWLQLLEKMVNPRAILDSPYALATTQQPQSPKIINFEPIFYLVEVHQLAMLAIQRIWKRKPIHNYGVSMTETIMTILKHLIKSYTMLSERFQFRMNETVNETKISEQNKKSQHTPDNDINVNGSHLQVLTDMGFQRQHVLEALHNTTTLEQATDYLLNHSEASCSTATRESDGTALNASYGGSHMDVDVSNSSSILKIDENISMERDALEANKNEFFKLKLISKERFDIFCNETLDRIFAFMEMLPETVNSGADLLTVIYRRQNVPGKQKFINNMLKNISDCLNKMCLNMDVLKSLKNKKQEDIVTGITATKLNIRLKVLFLLLDEIYSDLRKELCNGLSKERCLNFMILLLNKYKAMLENQNDADIKPITPCWLQSLIDLMDAIDSVSIILQRKANMRAVCSDVWKWYDTSTGKWNVYSEANNAIIKNAFKNGERSIIINIGRQRYTINFNCMTQVSEASGSHRPVMPGLKIAEAIAMYYRNSNPKVENILTQIKNSDSDPQNTRNSEISLSLSAMLNFYNDGNTGSAQVQQNEIRKDEDIKRDFGKEEHHSNEDHKTTSNTAQNVAQKSKEKQQRIVLDEEYTGLSKFKTEDLIECIVFLLNPKLSLNFETKLSLLKLCARLTKDFRNAKAFVHFGGIQILLKMKQSCALMGFPTYAIIIIRHVLEAPKVLQESFECILSARANQSVPVGHRDLIYILTQVSSAVARDPHIFLAASMNILRGDYSPNPTLTFDDSKFLVISKKLNNRKDGIPSNLDNSDVLSVGNIVSVKVVKDLLYAIVQPCSHYGGPQLNQNEDSRKEEPKLEAAAGTNDRLSTSSGSIQPEESYEPCCCSWHIPSSGHNHSKPVLSRATIIKILADAVRSYQSLVPHIIIEHTYNPSDSVLVEKPQSCLSFVIDNFLPIINCQQNAEVSIMSRTLITSLADCYCYTSVQTKVVEEVHEGIIRCLLLPESFEKHARLQVLIGMLPLMIESPMLVNKLHVQNNNMYSILLRQGIMADLCKIAQYIDLSNSYTYPTILSVLRPLEILLRLTVAPGALSAKRFVFGNSLQSGSSPLSHRFYPRLTSGSNNGNNSSTVSGDNVLRDIIRNVLSDRRHGFEFMFNPDELVIDSEESSNTAGISIDDEGEESQPNIPISSNLIHSNRRSQLNLNRLLNDFMQSERNFERTNNHHSSNGSGVHSGMDHYRNSSNNSESGNNENGEGESDEASSSSETAAVTIDNVTMGDVSTSDTNDSDSNGSTENDDRNDEEEEDDDENRGMEEGPDDPSEMEPDDETRQFIEVFNHIYDRETSESALNFADIDADDEASEIGVNAERVLQLRNTETNVTQSERDYQSSELLSGQQSVPFVNTEVVVSSNSQSNVQSDRNETRNPTSALHWISPRIDIIDGNVSNEGINMSSINSNERIISVHSTNDSSSNVVSDNPSPQRNLTSTNSQNTGPSIQRRDATRRLIFLDQQYCVQMPSINNPTEEGQLELFNQDALHWWLEEAKHLDFESQTNACLYVSHLLIPFLINELKVEQRVQKKDEFANGLESLPTSSSRKSAIPVPILQSAQQVSVPNIAEFIESSNYMRDVVCERTDDHIQETSSPTLELTLRESDTNMESSAQFFAYNSLNTNPEQPTSNELSQSNVNDTESPFNEPFQRISSHQTTSEHRDDNIIENESLYREENTENDDDENEVLSDNRSYPDVGDLNLVSNEGLGIETQNSLQPISENVEQATRNQVLSNDFPAPQTELESRVLNIDQNIVNIDNTEDLNDNFEEFERPSSTPSDLCTESSGLGINPHVNATLLESNNIQEMPPEVRNALGSLEIPEGVDPSFLAALPEEMREEVIQEHLRMQRVRQRAQQSSSQTTHDSVLEVNPEFLAALPPNIQSEVLMQQRIEQQRQVAQSTNPEDPVDAGLFFQNLPDSLRQAILTDMDESQIASLPPDLAAEAQYLRSDWESRNSARLNAHQANTLSSTARARFPSSSNSSQDPRWQNSIWYDANGTPQIQHHHHTTIIHHHTQQHGKPIALLLMEDENNLLDPDSLSTLLLFLFIEDTKINFSRLHRIVRNLCFHVPTREWIIHALISIIQKVNLEKTTHDFKKAMKPQWLKFRAYTFGYKSDVFIINKFRQCCKNTNYYTILDIFLKNYTLDINPQATQMIIRNCLDILFVLAKHFPRSFIPFNIDNKITTDNADTVPSHSISKNDSFLPSTHADSPLMENKQNFAQSNIDFDDLPTTSKDAFVNRSSQKSTCLKNKNASEELIYNTNAKSFWDVILSLDMGTSCRSLNLHAFPLKANPRWEWKKKKKVFLSFSDSPFSKLLEMLPYKDICRSPQLTDMLVKLLGSLSISLSKESNQLDAESNAECFQQCNKPEDLKSKKETDDLVSCKEDYKKDIHSKLSKPKKTNRTIYSKNFSQLKLIVEVLTHQSGTSEGLDDIAKLISNLSLCSEVYNAIFLHYLQKAILGLSDQVQKSIQNLWDELRQANVLSNETASTSQNAQNLKDNFNAENVNMSERTKIKSLSQLQIPAMKKLLSTSSSQIFFLKTLKMFTQVREFYDNRNINKTLESSLLCKQSLSQIFVLDSLWNSLSACLFELEKSKDEYAVLVLQPVVEVFFLIYGSQKTESKGNSRRLPSAQENYSEIQNAESQKLMDLEATNTSYLSSEEDQFSTDNAKNTKSDQLCVKETQIKNDRLKLISFAEKHRSIINQILRQSHVHLSDGPFAVLVDYTRILDFDVKRKYFQTELERIDEGVRREENTVSVRRVTVFEDSFRVLYRLGSEEWKNRFYIVFEDEEGQDAGGLLREWYVIISREIFNPMYALFCVSPGDRVTYMINPSSYANPNHLSYFKFVGRVIAKAIHDNKLLECYFTRSFYKHILGKQVKYTDMESQDYEFYKGLDYLMKNNVSTLGYELTFSTEVQEFGMTQVRDLIPNGRDIVVTEENKFEYVQLVCQLKMSGSIRQQLDAFLEGFYDIIPKHLISIFNEQELELLISGLPDIDIEDLKLNTEYHKYTAKSNQIQWFWRALRSFDQADRAKFLQFVTGTSKVPLQGFKSLEGMNGIQKLQIHRDDRSTDRLPCAHTCFNQLDLPMYKSYEKLRSCLLKAIHECSEGFGFA